MHNLKIIFHVVIGHNIPFPFKMNLYIYIYMEIDLLTLYFLPLVGENSISNFEVLNDKNFDIEYLDQFFNHLCEHLKQKSLASHILEFIRKNKLNV